MLLWGRASDRIGRKPPLVFGTLGLAAAIASFGLSKKFWTLVLSRCVQGMFNGNIGITKAVMAEITDASNIAQGILAHFLRCMCSVCVDWTRLLKYLHSYHSSGERGLHSGTLQVLVSLAVC